MTFSNLEQFWCHNDLYSVWVASAALIFCVSQLNDKKKRCSWTFFALIADRESKVSAVSLFESYQRDRVSHLIKRVTYYITHAEFAFARTRVPKIDIFYTLWTWLAILAYCGEFLAKEETVRHVYILSISVWVLCFICNEN